MSAPITPELTQYEKARLERMARNQEKLIEMGVLTAAAALVTQEQGLASVLAARGVHALERKAQAAAARQANPAIPPRRSARKRNAASLDEELSTSDIENDIEDMTGEDHDLPANEFIQDDMSAQQKNFIYFFSSSFNNAKAAAIANNFRQVDVNTVQELVAWDKDADDAIRITILDNPGWLPKYRRLLTGCARVVDGMGKSSKVTIPRPTILVPRAWVTSDDGQRKSMSSHITKLESDVRKSHATFIKENNLDGKLTAHELVMADQQKYAGYQLGVMTVHNGRFDASGLPDFSDDCNTGINLTFHDIFMAQATRAHKRWSFEHKGVAGAGAGEARRGGRLKKADTFKFSELVKAAAIAKKVTAPEEGAEQAPGA